MGYGYWVWLYCLDGIWDALEHSSPGPPVSGATLELDLGSTGLQHATAAGGAWRVVGSERLERCVLWRRCERARPHAGSTRPCANPIRRPARGGTPGRCWSHLEGHCSGARHPSAFSPQSRLPRDLPKSNFKGTRQSRVQCCAACGRRRSHPMASG
jgi:hypothetical protein